MINGKTVLAIIPARGGSKRLPRKNLLPLAGKPLIAWTIEAAAKCGYIDNLIVSTDDNEIAEVAKIYGASVPFKRPAILASDEATSCEVIKHAIDYFLELHNRSYELILLLQPTSPLRTAHHIREALELFEFKGADSIVSLCEVEHSPLWSNTLPEDLSLCNFMRQETINKRSQDLPVYYRLNGAIYLIKTSVFLNEKSLFVPSNSYAYIMDQKSSIDIDNSLQFMTAEMILSKYDKSTT